MSIYSARKYLLINAVIYVIRIKLIVYTCVLFNVPFNYITTVRHVQVNSESSLHKFFYLKIYMQRSQISSA